MLDRDSLPTLAAVPRKGDRHKEFSRRFAAGDSCFGILRGEQIVGYCWFSRKECRSTVYAFTINSATEIYGYDTDVSSSYRGRGLSPDLNTQLYPWLRSQGITRLYAWASIFNNPSNGLANKHRQKALAKMVYVSIFNIYERTYLLKDSGDNGEAMPWIKLAAPPPQQSFG